MIQNSFKSNALIFENEISSIKILSQPGENCNQFYKTFEKKSFSFIFIIFNDKRIKGTLIQAYSDVCCLPCLL
jgi:hypothetical protein